MLNRLFFVLIICFQCFWPSSVFADYIGAGESSQDIEANNRIALVLGGGGARGAAHVGVIEVLEEQGIYVDCVVGTSMGALVAGAYASGKSPEAMHASFKSANWTDIFLDDADYSQLSYRRKQVTTGLLTGTEMGITKDGLTFPPGFIAGEKIKLFFNRLVGDDQGARQLDALSIPAAAVTTDIVSGERVVFTHGNLSLAMRASMSVPGLLTPVEFQGRKLVDGGLVDNLPIEVAKYFCNADRIIAVDVGSPLKSIDEVDSLLSVTSQMIEVLAQQNVMRSQKLLGDKDLLIHPDLEDISAGDFSRYEQAIAAGRTAALQLLDSLQSFRSKDIDKAPLLAGRKIVPAKLVPISNIEIKNVRAINPQYVRKFIRQKIGENLDLDTTEQDLQRLYGEGYFESVDYMVRDDSDGRTLSVLANEKKWSSDYILFGLTLSDEYRQGANMNLRAAYRNVWLNSWGGEFFAVGTFGGDPSLTIDFYQPLGAKQNFFIEPKYVKKREQFNFYQDRKNIAEYSLDTSYSEFAIGQNVDIWGQLRLAWREYNINAEAVSQIVQLPSVHEKYTGWIAEANFDERDRLYFPTRGWKGELSYFSSSNKEYAKLNVNLDAAFLIDDFVLGAAASYQGGERGELPVFDSSFLGGFLNLSAYATNQIIAQRAYYGQLRLEKIIGRMPLGLNGDLRMGLALEGAKVESPYTINQLGEHLNSAAIYLGGETPLGPVYLGYGFNLTGDFNIYFQLGAF